MKEMRRRVRALEGGSSSTSHERWVDAIAREERGEVIDWGSFTPAEPADLAALEGEGGGL